uniref:Uncharacterized protein n=1 Tax=Tanacetum cinerariifolium TaxID=118510 RepID=A0A699I9S8_TANCI|nr:hypothetical protein [Tanacetum cinerariifolium]
MCTLVFVDLKSSTQADGAQSSRVPVPLPKDPYEAIRQAYLVGTDIESEPFEGKARTPESPHIVEPPTCHVEESEGSGMFGTRSTSSDTTVPLSPDHPLTHTTPTLVPIIRWTVRMAVRVLPARSSCISTGIAEVAALSDLAFCKSEEDDEVEESSDSNSESEGAEDEGPITEDEDPAAGDEGLAARVKGPGVDDEGYGLDDESYGLDDKSHGVDDKSCGLEDEGHSVEINGLNLEEEEEVVPEGQQQVAPVVGTTVSAPLGLGSALEPERSGRVSTSRQPLLTTWTDPEDGMVYIDVFVYPPPAPPVQTPTSSEWTSGLLLISPSPSVVPSLVSSPMILLIVPSPMATSIATILVDED